MSAAVRERYQVERKIGQGGMGVVYVAQDLQLGRPVVLKQLLVADPEQARRLAIEAQILGQLNHPRILKLYGVEDSDGIPVLVLELLEGVTLHAELEALGPLPVPRALEVGEMIAEALEPVHRAGLVHRDLKPENVLLTGDGLKVLDFGLARLAARPEDAAVTQPGIYVGTPTCMSPEQWACEPIDGRTDLYALGVLLFEALAGKPPFDEPTVTALAVAHMTQNPPPLDHVAPAVGPRLARLVAALLSKQKTDRPPDAAAVRREIAAIRAGDDAPASNQPEHPPDQEATFAIVRQSRPGRGSAKPRPPAAIPAAEPSRGLELPLTVISVVALILTALAVMRSRPQEPVTAPRSGPKDLVVSYHGPRTIAVTFRTGASTTWTLRAPGGASVTDPAAATMHALEIPVDPWTPPDELELVGPGAGDRLALVPPPGARSRIRRLAAAVRAAKLDLKLTDEIYNAIRPTLRDFLTIDPLTATAASAARQIQSRPELAMPLMNAIGATRAAVSALDAVRGIVSETLTGRDAPAAVQDELLDALARLDHLDAAATYFGQPAPAGVARLLTPVFDVHVAERKRPTPSAPPPAAAMPVEPACVAYTPKNSDGIALFLPAEDVTHSELGFASAMALARIPGLTKVDAGSRIAFRPCCRAGPAGWRLSFQVSSFPAGIYLWLELPGHTAAVPVRLEPAQDAGVSAALTVTCRIPASLVRVDGPWMLTQRRLFLAFSRIYFVVTRIDSAPE